jgi:hypothetical protein
MTPLQRFFEYGLILKMVPRGKYNEVDWVDWRENLRSVYPTDDLMMGKFLNPSQIAEQYTSGAEKIFYLDIFSEEELKRRQWGPYRPQVTTK